MVASLLALAALVYTAKGTAAAIDALESQIESERPILRIAGLSLKKLEDSTTKRPLNLAIAWHLVNDGKTGCWIEEIAFRSEAGKTLPTDLDQCAMFPLAAFIPTKGGLASASDDLRVGFSKGEANRVFGTQRVAMAGYIRYRDSGQRAWQTHFAYLLVVGEDGNSTDFYPVPSALHWEDKRVRDPRRKKK